MVTHAPKLPNLSFAACRAWEEVASQFQEESEESQEAYSSNRSTLMVARTVQGFHAPEQPPYDPQEGEEASTDRSTTPKVARTAQGFQARE
jgi:hypothetical protein